MHWANRFAGEGEEDRVGKVFAELGQGDAAARPLDGGALTRWGTRTPARGSATAPCSLLHRLRSLSVALASVLCEERRGRAAKRETKRERESRGANELGFSGEGARCPF